MRLAEVRMATKTSVVLEDDIGGGPAAETVRFALDGSDYEIDLNEMNAARLRRQLTPFVEHARKVGMGRGQRRRAGRSASNRERSSDIRAWAKDQGIPISDRGRIPESVVEQYEAATRAH
jgi:hypothetical protein